MSGMDRPMRIRHAAPGDAAVGLAELSIPPYAVRCFRKDL